MHFTKVQPYVQSTWYINNININSRLSSGVALLVPPIHCSELGECMRGAYACPAGGMGHVLPAAVQSRARNLFNNRTWNPCLAIAIGLKCVQELPRCLCSCNLEHY